MDINQLSPEQRAELEEKLKNMSPEELAKLQSQECIFCSIIAGKIPSKKVYEDELCVAVLDINPGAKGHMFLMPKNHISIMPQLDEGVGGHMLQVARELSRSLLKNLHASGSSIFIANGLAAGQRAQHFMIHIIPRKEGDALFGYEKHIVDEDKRRALRDLIAARMEQITDFKDIYASEENFDNTDEKVEAVSESIPKPEIEQESEVEEEIDGDSDDAEETEESEEDEVSETPKEPEVEEEPGHASDSTLDDIANLFK